MAIREKLDSSRLGTIVVGAVLCLVGAASLAYELWPTQYRGNFTTTFFSDDDGKTYYADSVFNLPPYDHNGKQAYRAFVYQCDQGKFVGFLFRYKPDARKRLLNAYEKAKSSGLDPTQPVLGLMATDSVRYGGVEIKLPGETEWKPMPGIFPHIKSPDGSTSYPVDP